MDQETVTSVVAGIGMGSTLLGTWLAVKASKARDLARDEASAWRGVVAARQEADLAGAVTQVIDLGLAHPLAVEPAARWTVPSAEDFRQWHSAASHGRVTS